MILSVQKAMRILTVLSDSKSRSVSLMEIAQKTGYPKPTCSHLLETLCHDGYAVRISHTDGYTLGPAIYCLTRHGRYEEDLITLCRPVMRWMEKSSRATVVLSVIQGSQKFIIDYADTEQNLLSEHSAIRTDDIYRTATGRAILAHMERDAVKEVYARYGAPPPEQWRNVPSFEVLLERLEVLRDQDIIFTGIENGIVTQSSIGLGCPLFRKHTCIGAIGLAWKVDAIGQPLPSEIESTLCRVLKKGAQEIRRRIAYEEMSK